MAKKAAPKKKTKAKAKPKERQRIRPIRWLLRWVRRVVFLTIAGLLLWIVAYSVINPPTTPYIVAERFRVGSIDRHWVPLEEIVPVMARAVVAAEDANFCNHGDWIWQRSRSRWTLEMVEHRRFPSRS